MAGPTPLYRLTSVNQVYKQKRGIVHALREVDLDISDDEFVVLRGPSGAGKSTLLNILAGICRPSSGAVEFNGTPLYSAKNRYLGGLRRYRNRYIGFVFQDFQLMGGLTARQNIELPLYFGTKHTATPASERIAELTARLGIDNKLERLPHQLSGGEAQRVAIARALVHEPAVVFADEPTGNLDGKTETNILKIIAEERKRRNFLFIAASHSDKFIRKADRVVLIEDGGVSLK